MTSADADPDQEKNVTPDSPRGGTGLGIGLGVLLVLCCAGPLLLAAVATGGAGAWLVANGALLIGVGALVAAAAIGAIALSRRS